LSVVRKAVYVAICGVFLLIPVEGWSDGLAVPQPETHVEILSGDQKINISVDFKVGRLGIRWEDSDHADRFQVKLMERGKLVSLYNGIIRGNA